MYFDRAPGQPEKKRGHIYCTPLLSAVSSLQPVNPFSKGSTCDFAGFTRQAAEIGRAKHDRRLAIWRQIVPSYSLHIVWFTNRKMKRGRGKVFFVVASSSLGCTSLKLLASQSKAFRLWRGLQLLRKKRYLYSGFENGHGARGK